MEGEKLIDKQESDTGFEILPSATESLLHFDSATSPWPEEIKNNPELIKQAEIRLELSNDLSKIFECLAPENLNINEAVESGKLNLEVAAGAYNKLTDFLESDSLNSRIILYLPFELLPPISWEPKEEVLANALSRFREVYVNGWHDLLSIADVRANFVDGDVLEPELRTGPLERVVKAAHLVPKLVGKGMVNVTDVIELIKNNPESILSNSLIDTLPILVDLGLLTKDNLDLIVTENHLDLDKREREKGELGKIPTIITLARERWLKRREEEKNLPVKNLAEVNNQEKIKDLNVIIRAIENDPELSKYFYGAMIAFGSRIKGYGARDADLDYAVFVKAGVDFADRVKAQELLARVAPEDLKGKAVEFWLEEVGDKLKVRDFSDSDNQLADSNWVHVLFGGVWCGDQSSIKELHQKLLAGYLHHNDLRQVWLEEIEKDTLQYRLMHSGYDRYFPKQGRIETDHSQRIDGNSTFYDSGFRRLATKLFVTKVFLPELSK